MDFDHFNSVLHNVACDKNISRLCTQLIQENSDKAPNPFMTQRWLSMQPDLLQSTAKCAYRCNKYLTPEQQMKMMLHCVDETEYFQPRYIKKQ